MLSVVKAVESVQLDPLQDASEDIWKQKYRLQDSFGNNIDKDLLDTYKRVAWALVEPEIDELKESMYKQFLDALIKGCIPAGRILSNAGANEYKPKTSLINCTVSGNILDDIEDIFRKQTEAAKTLKTGAGIGYCFSTLRPKGAFVNGAGAKTSGPLSFMDVFDKMCFTVSSAGGRRGAQMVTFDCQHPDILDFIQAKREKGRLRQFNMSVLITNAFIEAVKADEYWPLVFPMTLAEYETTAEKLGDVYWREWPVTEGYKVNKEGMVACKVYKRLKARLLWDRIMQSTYDFAEPGFILIDEVNRMNNNWFCEHILATNPCVTGDTRLATQFGMVKVEDLYNSQAELHVTVDNRALGQDQKGISLRSAVPVFMTSSSAKVYKVTTKDGYEIKATDWHDFYTERGKIKLKDMVVGDKLLIQSGKGQFGTQGSKELGTILGLITGDGHFTNRGKGSEAAVIGLWGKKAEITEQVTNYVNALIQSAVLPKKARKVNAIEIPERNQVMIRSVVLAQVLSHYGFTKQNKLNVPEVVWQGSEECVKAYLQALFSTDGTVNVSSSSESCSVRLSGSEPSLLKDVQVLLANFGVFSRIRKRRDASVRMLPDASRNPKEYECKADYELIVDGESREVFMSEIGFMISDKTEKYSNWVSGKSLKKTQSFLSEVESIEYHSTEAVYDTTQKDNNTVIFNGLVTGQCGEQPLPPYGSCLLGSINLTSFVLNPFTDNAKFDWDSFKKYVHIFTRMLDNVCEIHGLPLEGQANELKRKRRHGMGYFGLGSAMTMLKMAYGSSESVEFTEKVTYMMAREGWVAGVELAREKGPAPIFNESIVLTQAALNHCEAAAKKYKAGDKISVKELFVLGNYMQKFNTETDKKVLEDIKKYGCRFTHHSSIAPTGTMALSVGNNASNGIEPSFSFEYARNVIKEGKKSKEKINVTAYELLKYRELVNPDADPFSDDPAKKLPSYFVDANTITPKEHVDVQAAAQIWIDSSISKTANVPTDFPFAEFESIYLYAVGKNLKGCTTFRFNPEHFQGVLVNEKDIANTTYEFTLADGTIIKAQGNEEVFYDGETHTAANLHDAISEGYYGKL